MAWKEYKTSEQKVTWGVGLTLDGTGRFPLIAKRIWGTLADAQAWVDDKTTNSTATPGLYLSVINDGANNGAYYVQSIASGTTPGVLVKLGSATAAQVEIKKETTAEEGYLASYSLYQNGAKAGATINIPKDYLVKSAEIKTATADIKSGETVVVPNGHKYIDFVINSAEGTGNESHIYLDVLSLVEDFTVATGATEVQLAVSDGREISATLVDGGVSTDKLAAKAVTTAKIADKAVQTGQIDDSAVTNAQIADATIARDKIDSDFEADIAALEAYQTTLAANATTSGSVLNAIASAKTYTDNVIEGLGGEATSDDAAIATVKVTTDNGEVSDVVVTTTSAGVATGGTKDARTLSAATATGAVTGADIAKIKGYVDNVVSDATTDLAISASGDAYVSAAVNATDNKKIDVKANVATLSATAGSAGVYNAEGTQTTAPTAPTLTGTANKLTDASDVATKVKTYVDGKVAIEAARSDANTVAAIKALDKTATSTTGTNVTVTVSETDGIVSVDSVSESYATITKTATTSTAATPKTDAAITVKTGDEGKLVKASDLANVAAYAADKATEEAHRVDAKIAGLNATQVGGTGKVVTSVSETAGVISATSIDLTAANVAATAITGTDSKVAVSGTTLANQIDNLATAIKTAEKAAIAAQAEITTGSTTDGHVTVSVSGNAGEKQTYTITTSDIASAQLLGTTADDKTKNTAFGYIAKEADARTSAITAAINALDVAKQSETGKYVKTITETDGKVSVEFGQVAATEVSYSKTDDKVITAATNVSAAIKELDVALDAVKGSELTYKTIALTAAEIAALTDSANIKEAYKTVSVTTGGTETQVGDTIKIYKDSSLKSADFVDKNASNTAGQYLKLVYIKVDGTEETVYVDMSALVEQSEVENGIQQSGGKLSIKKDATSESFLTVGADGIKLSGVQTAIDNAQASATTVVAQGTSHDHLSIVETAGADGHKIYTISTNDIASASALTQEASARSGQDDMIEGAVGLAADGSHVKTTGNYTSGATTVVGEISALDTQVKSNADAIKGLQDAKVSVSASTDTESAKYLEVSTNANKTVYTVKAKGIDTAISTAIQGLDKAESSVSGTNVSFKYSETDGIVTISNLTENYATVTATGYVSGTTTPSFAVASGDAEKLVKGKDLTSLATYAKGLVDAQADAQADAIAALDATVSQTGTDVAANGNNVDITIVETDGKLTSVTAKVDVFDCGEW